jgi:hypothetical protein
VNSMMRRKHAVDFVSFALDGEIAMHFNHCPASRHGVSAVYLDLVTILRGSGDGNENGNEARAGKAKGITSA